MLFAICFVIGCASVIGGARLAYRKVKRDRLINDFCTGELDRMPWNAALAAYQRGHSMTELLRLSEEDAAQYIGNSVFPKLFDAEELAQIQRSAVTYNANEIIANDPLAKAVYDKVRALCHSTRTELLRNRHTTVEGMRLQLASKVEQIVQAESLAATPITTQEIDLMRALFADDDRFKTELAAWLAEG